MARKVAWTLLLLVAALPAGAVPPAGTVSGLVRNSAGIPQMGATVEISASSLMPVLTVLTDAKGFYSASGIDPGRYSVKVSAASYLPAMREDIGVRAGANLVVNVTLNTLFEALQMMPARRQAGEEQDDWKWTLRAMGNRPVLRVLEDGPLVVVSNSEKDSDRVLKARVSFLAGSDGDGFNGASDMSTSFKLESSLFSAGTLSLDGDVGYNGAYSPATVLRASYTHQFADGSRPEIAITARRFATPDSVAHNAALQALALSLSDNFQVADLFDVTVGTEYHTLQFMGRVSALKPFGAVNITSLRTRCWATATQLLSPIRVTQKASIPPPPT